MLGVPVHTASGGSVCRFPESANHCLEWKWARTWKIARSLPLVCSSALWVWELGNPYLAWRSLFATSFVLLPLFRGKLQVQDFFWINFVILIFSSPSISCPLRCIFFQSFDGRQDHSSKEVTWLQKQLYVLSKRAWGVGLTRGEKTFAAATKCILWLSPFCFTGGCAVTLTRRLWIHNVRMTLLACRSVEDGGFNWKAERRTP